MSSSARARGGSARLPFTPSRAMRSGNRSESTSRPSMKEKDVIVIESEDDNLSECGDYGRDSFDGLPTPQCASSAVSNHAVPGTPTEKNGDRAPGRIAAFVRSLDTTLHTPPTLAPSSGLDSPHSSNKTNGLVSRRDESSMKDADTSGCRLPHIPSAFAPSASPHGTQSSKCRSSNNIAGVIHNKADTVLRTWRRRLNDTPTSAATENSEATLTGPSSAHPPAFPLAVKPRVYSSWPGGKRNIGAGSKKLEAFGFVSAASLPGATARNVTTIPLVAKRRVAAIAVSPLPKVKPEPVSEPIFKPVKQEAVRILGGGSRESLPSATRNPTAATAATPTSIPKTVPEPIKQEPLQEQVNAPRLPPQTPEKPLRAKRGRTPSYSIGTSRDPYAISSDSDSEYDDSNLNGNPYSCPPLKSFAEITDTYETASDVEAVLNQFPAWLNSPSPSELRSSYLSASGPTKSSSPGKRLWGDGIGNRGRVGRESRRVRFCGGDGFTTSPVPTKRRATPSRLTSSGDGVTSSVERNSSPTGETNSQSQLTPSIDQTSSPTKRVAPLEQVGFLMRETLATQGDASPLHRLPHNLQTALPKKRGPADSSPAGLDTPRVEITVQSSNSDPVSSDDNLSEDMNTKSKLKLNSNLNNPDHSGSDKSVQQQKRGNILRKETENGKDQDDGLKKKKEGNKRTRMGMGMWMGSRGRNDNGHCRHRNRDRESWRAAERLKRL